MQDPSVRPTDQSTGLSGAALIELIKGNRLWLLVAVVVGSVVSFLFVSLVSPKYVARAYIASNQEMAAGGQLQQLVGLFGSSATAGGSAVVEFTVVMQSRSTAEKLVEETDILQALYAHQWDEATQSWTESTGFGAWAKSIVYESMLGFELPKPGPDLLVEHVQENLGIDMSSARPGLVEISYESEDAEFAKRFLTSLMEAAESTLVLRYEEISAARLAYAQHQLEQSHPVDVLQALNSIITSELQRSVTLASGSLESMRVVLFPEVSLIPRRPSLVVSFALFNVTALLFTFLLLVVLHGRKAS